MIAACLAQQGYPLVRVHVGEEELYRDLRGFKARLQRAAGLMS